jgi:hypothetical protein
MWKRTNRGRTGKEMTAYGLPAKADNIYSAPRLYKFFGSVAVLSIQQT